MRLGDNRELAVNLANGMQGSFAEAVESGASFDDIHKRRMLRDDIVEGLQDELKEKLTYNPSTRSFE